MHNRQRSRRPLVIVATVAAIGLGACSDNGDDNNPTTEPTGASTPTPSLTAPPTQTPEEKAEAEIIDTFETIIADWDEYRTNASDYGNGDNTWNAELVGSWQVEAQAYTELTNWIGSWRRSELNQVGDTVIASHSTNDIKLNVTDDGVHDATSTACLDMTGLTYEDYQGQPAELPPGTPQYQTWELTWMYLPNASPEAGVEEAGWYMHKIDVTLGNPC